MKLSREEAWAGTLESMVDNRVVFYLRRYNRDYQDYSRQMKELCEKYPAIIQLIDGNNGVTGTKKKGNFGMYEAVPIGRSRKGVPL